MIRADEDEEAISRSYRDYRQLFRMNRYPHGGYWTSYG